MDPKAQGTDRLFAEADRGGQDEIGSVGLQEVDRAHVRSEASLDQPDDLIESGGRGAVLRDEMADLVQRQQEGIFPDGRRLQ